MGKKCVKIIFFVLVVGMAVEVTKAHYYVDVTTCFTPTAEMGEPEFLTLHYDSIDRPTTCDEINRYHRDTCKWDSGIAYHYVVMGDKIYKCRDEHQIGTHVKNGNSKNIGICVHGDFNKTRPTLKQQILLIVLINKLCWQYNIPKQNIKGHRDWVGNNTICPGKNFDLDGLKKWIFTTN